MGLATKNAMNRTTNTTGNGYIRDRGRGGGGGAFQRQGDRNTTEDGVGVGTMKTVAYMLEGKEY